MATIDYVVARAARVEVPRLGFQLRFDTELDDADLVLGRNLETDGGFESAVVISLFSDRRAGDDDGVPELDRRGWWADAYADDERDRFGSRLWLLERETASDRALRLAITYAEEALAWMVEDGIAASVRASSSRLAENVLALTVKIARPGETATWQRTWEVHFGGV